MIEVAGGTIIGLVLGMMITGLRSENRSAAGDKRARRQATQSSLASRQSDSRTLRGGELTGHPPAWGMAGRPSSGWDAAHGHRPSFGAIVPVPPLAVPAPLPPQAMPVGIVPAALPPQATPAGTVPAHLAAVTRPAHPRVT